MKVLMVGAAGHVGGILRPALEARHECRYVDLKPIPGAEDRTVVGSVTDHEVMAQAMEGIDVALQLAMAPYRGADEPRSVDLSYDVHVKGMHRVLEAAVRAGTKRVVYASTLSVYRGNRAGGLRTEEMPPDAVDLYGLTKRLGEEVCKAFAVRHAPLSVLALQLVQPRTEEQWAKPPEGRQNRNYMTGPEDLRDAWLRAIELEDHQGYDAVFICSDLEAQFLDLSKAKRLLGWVPQGR
ncbi:MAG: NAD(P)-dependent oxidoreductase [Armatimonadetes bacterium]|nr:NAD(P)-dependent oxidoreductase [Armatimonadota bacterium]